jgi:hypothetical protein
MFGSIFEQLGKSLARGGGQIRFVMGPSPDKRLQMASEGLGLRNRIERSNFNVRKSFSSGSQLFQSPNPVSVHQDGHPSLFANLGVILA